MSKGGERTGQCFMSLESETRTNQSELVKKSLIQIFRKSVKNCSRLIRNVVQASATKIFKYTLVPLSRMSGISGEVYETFLTLSIYFSAAPMQCQMIFFQFITFHYSLESPWPFVNLCTCLVLLMADILRNSYALFMFLPEVYSSPFIYLFLKIIDSD